MSPTQRLIPIPVLALAFVFASPATALAQAAAPLSYLASPEVYKLLAENADFRVVLATWKPGQRDQQHAHSASTAYRLTDCRARVYAPNGQVLGEAEAKAGTVVLQQPIPSHSFENTGTVECQVLLVERK